MIATEQPMQQITSTRVSFPAKEIQALVQEVVDTRNDLSKAVRMLDERLAFLAQAGAMMPVVDSPQRMNGAPAKVEAMKKEPKRPKPNPKPPRALPAKEVT